MRKQNSTDCVKSQETTGKLWGLLHLIPDLSGRCQQKSALLATARHTSAGCKNLIVVNKNNRHVEKVAITATNVWTVCHMCHSAYCGQTHLTQMEQIVVEWPSCHSRLNGTPTSCSLSFLPFPYLLQSDFWHKNKQQKARTSSSESAMFCAPMHPWLQRLHSTKQWD